jgi:cell division septation protein DedD
MMTIRPSSDTDNASTPPEAAANTEEHKKRIPLIWIPATIGVGLLIAAIYLGGRIVKAHTQEPEAIHVATPVIAPAKPVPQPAIPEPAPPAPAQKPVASTEPLTAVTPEDGIPVINPQAGETYIQVGAFNAQATRRFVQYLHDKKLEPHVAPGPSPGLMRVLIGPFDNPDALNERKAQLATEGIDTFVRQY